MFRCRVGAAALLAMACSCSPGPVASADANAPEPAWISDKLTILAKIGIDAATDIQTKANYHWRWRARRELLVGDYRCPVGSGVDISRNTMLVIATGSEACQGAGGVREKMLKVYPDGSAEPMPSGD